MQKSDIYWENKFGPPNALAHYAEFGIVHHGSSYELRGRQAKTQDALRMMVGCNDSEWL